MTVTEISKGIHEGVRDRYNAVPTTSLFINGTDWLNNIVDGRRRSGTKEIDINELLSSREIETILFENDVALVIIKKGQDASTYSGILLTKLGGLSSEEIKFPSFDKFRVIKVGNFYLMTIDRMFIVWNLNARSISTFADSFKVGDFASFKDYLKPPYEEIYTSGYYFEDDAATTDTFVRSTALGTASVGYRIAFVQNNRPIMAIGWICEFLDEKGTVSLFEITEKFEQSYGVRFLTNDEMGVDSTDSFTINQPVTLNYNILRVYLTPDDIILYSGRVLCSVGSTLCFSSAKDPLKFANDRKFTTRFLPENPLLLSSAFSKTFKSDLSLYPAMDKIFISTGDDLHLAGFGGEGFSEQSLYFSQLGFKIKQIITIGGNLFFLSSDGRYLKGAQWLTNRRTLLGGDVLEHITQFLIDNPIKKIVPINQANMLALLESGAVLLLRAHTPRNANSWRVFPQSFNLGVKDIGIVNGELVMSVSYNQDNKESVALVTWNSSPTADRENLDFDSSKILAEIVVDEPTATLNGSILRYAELGLQIDGTIGDGQVLSRVANSESQFDLIAELEPKQTNQAAVISIPKDSNGGDSNVKITFNSGELFRLKFLVS